jgi:hypothetical protein
MSVLLERPNRMQVTPNHVHLALLALIKHPQVNCLVLCALQALMVQIQDKLPRVQLVQVLVSQASRLLKEATQ